MRHNLNHQRIERPSSVICWNCGNRIRIKAYSQFIRALSEVSRTHYEINHPLVGLDKIARCCNKPNYHYFRNEDIISIIKSKRIRRFTQEELEILASYLL